MGKQRDSDDGLSESQRQALTDQLVQKRRELMEVLDELNQQIAIKQDCSVSDAAEAASLREVALRATTMAKRHRETITAIDQALERIEQGTYGICESTGEPIAYARLQIIPWARTAKRP